MKRFPHPRSVIAGSGLVGFLLAAPAADAIPDPDLMLGGDRQEQVETLLSLGLHRDAERWLARDLDEGADWARSSALRLRFRTGRIDEAAQLMERWGGVDSLGTEANFFVLGRIRESRGEWAEAAEAYSRSAGEEPLLADHAAFRSALSYAKAGDAGSALELYEKCGAIARGTTLASKAFWEAARLAARAGEPERALASLERIPRRSPIARADLLDLEAAIYRTLEQPEREARALRELMDRSPSSERAIRATERLPEIAALTPADRIAFAEVALRNRHATLAEAYARQVLQDPERPDDPVLEGQARLRLGQALAKRKQYTDARAELERLPDGAATADRAEALLERARCLWRVGQIDACLAEYDLIADGDWPEEFRATAAWEAGREAKDNRRWEEAELRLGEFQRLFPEHDYADDAAWHRGRALTELGRPEDAIQALDLLRVRYPQSGFVQEAAYWTANLRAELADAEGACAEFARLLAEHPDSYWSERARFRMAADGCTADTTVARGSDEDPIDWLARLLPGIDPEAARKRVRAIEDSDRFRRARVLSDVALVGEAETELGNLRAQFARDNGALLVFAQRAWRLGVPREAMRAILVLKSRTGREILSGDMPLPVARLLYPVDHLDVVLRWSGEHELDPWFVFAVMREESWFDAEALSWAGAQGLMQIMPSTGRDLARRVGMRGFAESDLLRPEVNIRLGTYYLSSLLQDLDREPALALSAYNAGKRNALRWRNSLGGEFDVDRYVAGITYRETYGYVQKVTRSWTIYRHLYGELLDRLDDLARDPPDPGADE